MEFVLGEEKDLGSFRVRPFHLYQKGLSCPGHTHNFDHLTQVVRGAVHVLVKGPDGAIVHDCDFVAPSYFLVLKDHEHTITALEDDTEFWCMFAHRDDTGAVTQHITGFEKAYR